MSRKQWFCLVPVTLILGSVGYWLYMKPAETRLMRDWQGHPVMPDIKEPEACEVIEPLLVERGKVHVVPPRTPETDPMPRVVLEPGMKQPPRPDEERVRMPYADEESILPRSDDPIARILDATRAILDPIEEESEPETMPRTMPTCPHHGQCPFPYRRY